MPTTHGKKIFFLSAIFGIYLLSWILQSHFLFNSDVSWLMVATQRLLSGGTYTHDFFEMNPPMVLYSYIPAVFIAKIFSFPTDIAIRIYVDCLALCSLCFCYLLTNKIDSLTRYLFLFTLAILFLLFPFSDFGQREHLLIIFTMPYFLLVVHRLQNSSANSTLMAAWVGLFSGVGFIIKPYFLLSFLLVEIYFCWKKGSVKAFFRPEIVGIVLVGLLFFLSIIVFNRDYLTIVIPFAAKFYYQQYGFPFRTILFSPQAWFTYFAIVLYVLRRANNPYPALSTVLALASVGFLFSFLLQHTPWNYHALPMVSTSILLIVLLFSLLITPKSLTRWDYISFGLWAFLFVSYLCWRMDYITLSIRFQSGGYFGLFAVIFGLIFYRSYRYTHYLKILAATVFVWATGWLLNQYLLHSPLQVHLFFIVTLFLFLVFAFCIPEREAVKKLPFIFSAAIGVLLLSYPFYQGACLYNLATANAKQYQRWLAVLQEYQYKTVYFLSDNADFAFPGTEYTKSIFISRFGCLGFVPELLYSDNIEAYHHAYALKKNSMDFLVNAIADEINKNKPDIIFVDMRNTNAIKVKKYFGRAQLDYIRFFSENANFKIAWNNYHYVKTVDGQPLFRFLVYQRTEPRASASVTGLNVLRRLLTRAAQ